MFEFIRGTLVSSSPIKAVIDVRGVGYALFVPINSHLPNQGEEVTLYTSLIIREDAHTLFGFLTLEERDLFESLRAVSGIGPKTALALIGHMTIDVLYSAISQADAKSIAKTPGIGKKTAERLIIEMRDKLKGLVHKSAPTKEVSTNSDALNALIHLGYNQAAATKAIQKVLDQADSEPPLPELITSALRCL